MATNEIVLGSGKLYIANYTSSTEISSLSTFCTTSNYIGAIQGGASVAYTPTTYEVKDDMNTVYKRFITSEKASLKSGVLTWDTEALSKFIGNKSYSEDTSSHVKTLKLGGNGAREMDEFVVVFEHVQADGDTIRVGLVGTNDAGLSMAFQADRETVIDAEFNAVGHDSTGTLLIIEETPATTTGEG